LDRVSDGGRDLRVAALLWELLGRPTSRVKGEGVTAAEQSMGLPHRRLRLQADLMDDSADSLLRIDPLGHDDAHTGSGGRVANEALATRLKVLDLRHDPSIPPAGATHCGDLGRSR
jgi:hypothetical protein